jgi:hypothetical protein
MISLPFTSAVLTYIAELNAFDKWLVHRDLPSGILGRQVILRENWQAVATYEKNKVWMRLLDLASVESVNAERKHYGVDWYNDDLPAYADTVVKAVEPAVTKLQVAIAPHVAPYPKSECIEWMRRLLTRSVRELQLPILSVRTHWLVVTNILLAGYIPYAADADAIYVS